MGTYLAGASNPSLLREYDRKKSEQNDEEAPKRRADETESEYSERVSKYQVVKNAMDRL